MKCLVLPIRFSWLNWTFFQFPFYFGVKSNKNIWFLQFIIYFIFSSDFFSIWNWNFSSENFEFEITKYIKEELCHTAVDLYKNLFFCILKGSIVKKFSPAAGYWYSYLVVTIVAPKAHFQSTPWLGWFHFDCLCQ